MRQLVFVLAATSIVGCATIPRLTEPWTIEGRVVAEADGKPLELKTINLLRFEHSGIIFGGDYPFMSLQTNADGKFWVSGIVAGRFTLSSKCPVFGGFFEPLGQLQAGQHIEREFVFHTCLAPAR